MDVLEMQSDESILFDMTFVGKLRTGETIASVTSIAAVPSTLVIGSATISSPIIQFRISNASIDTYKITALVYTSLGNTLECDGALEVKDG